MESELETTSHGNREGDHFQDPNHDVSSKDSTTPTADEDIDLEASSVQHKGSKKCSLCHTPRDVLIRCQIDDTGAWNFICTGKCWKEVSGGVVDGDGSNKWYKYGGMWKNKHEGVSAKIKGGAKKRNKEAARAEGTKQKKEKKARKEREEGEEIDAQMDGVGGVDVDAEEDDDGEGPNEATI